MTAWLAGAERFPGREALWHAAAECADMLDAWHVLFDAGHRALDTMSASRAKVALGLWISDRHGDHGGDERGIRHALEHVLRAAPLHDKAFTALEQMHEATQNWTGILTLLDLALAADDLERCAAGFLVAMDRASDTANVVRIEPIEQAARRAVECARSPVGERDAGSFVQALRTRWGDGLQDEGASTGSGPGPRR